MDQRTMLLVGGVAAAGGVAFYYFSNKDVKFKDLKVGDYYQGKYGRTQVLATGKHAMVGWETKPTDAQFKQNFYESAQRKGFTLAPGMSKRQLQAFARAHQWK